MCYYIIYYQSESFYKFDKRFQEKNIISTPKHFHLLVVLCLQKIKFLFDAFTVFRDGELEGLRLLWWSLKIKKKIN